MKAISKLSISVVAPFSLVKTIFVTVLSFLIYGEVISWQIIVGILIVFLGLVFIAKLSKKEEVVKKDNRYILLLIGSGLISSFSGIIDKYALNNNYIEKGGTLFFFMLFLSIFYGILYFKNNKKINFSKLKSNYFLILIGVSMVLSEIIYYYALDMENSSLGMISLVKRFSIFITVFLAALILKEKNILKKILILIFMFVGISLILLI